MSEWVDIKHAPKKDEKSDCRYTGPWILGVNKYNEQRVIRWTTEYPCSNGVWMYAYEPTDYIDGIASFQPTHFKLLDDGPHKR